MYINQPKNHRLLQETLLKTGSSNTIDRLTVIKQ